MDRVVSLLDKRIEALKQLILSKGLPVFDPPVEVWGESYGAVDSVAYGEDCVVRVGGFVYLKDNMYTRHTDYNGVPLCVYGIQAIPEGKEVHLGSGRTVALVYQSKDKKGNSCLVPILTSLWAIEPCV